MRTWHNCGLTRQLCAAALLLAPLGGHSAENVSSARPQSIALQPEYREILDSARRILAAAPISDGERQLRLDAVESVLTGTVGVPDDDNPEIRNPEFWTEAKHGYIVAASHTAAEAISDLWTVHDGDGAPIPRIWCYKYSSLIMARAYIKYFQYAHDDAALAAINDLIGHRVFPNELTAAEHSRFWKIRPSGDHLLPGDEVWFENPYFERGCELIRAAAYQQAIDEGKSKSEAAAVAERTVKSESAGEEGSNVFYLGDNRFARGALSVTRLFRVAQKPANGSGGGGFEQVYTQKVFDLLRYEQHIIDDYFTVQAYMQAHPGAVKPSDFQIKQTRAFLDPNTTFPGPASTAQPDDANDRLIDAMASHNAPPELVERDNRRMPRFSADYDWAEQRRVRSAIVNVLGTKTDAMWRRLREHAADSRYVLTATRGGDAVNFTVGDFCADFATADLSFAYTRHLPAVVGRLPSSFDPEAAFRRHEQEWLSAQKPLFEIQIEICREALVQWPQVKGTLPGDDGASHTYTTAEKTQFVDAVTNEIAELRRTRRAVFLNVIVPQLPAPSGWQGFDESSAR